MTVLVLERVWCLRLQPKIFRSPEQKRYRAPACVWLHFIALLSSREWKSVSARQMQTADWKLQTKRCYLVYIVLPLPLLSQPLTELKLAGVEVCSMHLSVCYVFVQIRLQEGAWGLEEIAKQHKKITQNRITVKHLDQNRKPHMKS